MAQRFASKLATKNGSNGAVECLVLNKAEENARKPAFVARDQLKNSKRVVIKMGSAVITREDGKGLALGRLASIIEQVSEMQNDGRECVMITSGAQAFGKQKLSQELMMSMSMRETLQNTNSRDDVMRAMHNSFARPNAAVGQSGLQALYETMFRNYGIMVGQVLVTKSDFYNEQTRNQLFATINELMQLNIIPIINTNDAVSPPPQQVDDSSEGSLAIKDNDSLAARISVEIGADLAILMSDVEGIYNKPPSADDARIMHSFIPKDLETVEFGEKSETGTGGMESKVKSALWALEHGSSVVICNGMKHNTIRKIMDAEKIGSFFTRADNVGTPVEVMAQNARMGSRKLQSLSPAERAEAINFIADALVDRQEELLRVNKKDLAKAEMDGVTGPMFARLKLTPNKIQDLAEGMRQIASSSYNNIGRVVTRTKVSDTMDLVQKTVPIGVLMVIFESRPDALPQVASLAIASANGLLMKGGKEASYSNKTLMKFVTEALGRHGCADAISLVSSRDEVDDLLKLDNYIDLIIPRGSNDLVRSIKERSKSIPVLGHADGICHTYLDEFADLDKAIKIVVDAKTDYPAACNAMETLLVHETLVGNEYFYHVCNALKKANVEIYSGPKLSEILTFGPPRAEKLAKEYGDLSCTVEIVGDMEEAIDHIHRYGSGHTDSIVTENKENAERFLAGVDR